MNIKNTSWDRIFRHREPSKYPFDNVVSFFFNNVPKEKPMREINILEVGCGGANNLLFMAKEGANVFGIDSSEVAINTAKKRFFKEKLKGNFIRADFRKISYPNSFFDLIIDRCAVTCVDKINSKLVFSEIRRVLKKNGKFFFNTYCKTHTSHMGGKVLSNGITSEIQTGTLVGNGNLSFFDKDEIKNQFAHPWEIISLKNKKIKEYCIKNSIHSEWEVIIKLTE